MPDVRRERTGWRDEALSARHRAWGWDCPMVDIDFLVAEYDAKEPVAIIEYKSEYAAPQRATNASYQVLIKLATWAHIPFFNVRYACDFSWWKVTPLNGFAKDVQPVRCEVDEREFVTFLYRLRGRALPEGLFDSNGRLIMAVAA